MQILTFFFWFRGNQGSNNIISQKSDSTQNALAGTQQTSKPTQNTTHSPSNDQGISVPNNQSCGQSTPKG